MIRRFVGFFSSLRLVLLSILILLIGSHGYKIASAILLNLGDIQIEKVYSSQFLTDNDNQEVNRRYKASHFLQNATEFYPNNASAYRNLGHLYIIEGDYVQAIQAFLQSAQLSENPLIYEALGNAYQKIDDLDQAIAAWSKVGGSLARSKVEHGVKLFKNGMIDQAALELKLAIMIEGISDFDKVRAYQFLGGIYHEKGMLDKASFWQQSAINIAPDQADLYNELGLTLLHAGNVDLAVNVILQALALDPEIAEAYRSLGAAYEEKGMLEESIREYTRALALAPNDVWAHHGLGVTYWRAGVPELALAEWRKALTIDPNFEPARRYLDQYFPTQ